MGEKDIKKKERKKIEETHRLDVDSCATHLMNLIQSATFRWFLISGTLSWKSLMSQIYQGKTNFRRVQSGKMQWSLM